MWTRVLTLVRAQLAGEWYAERGARLPVAPVLFQLTIAGILCGLARDALPPYPYAIFSQAQGQGQLIAPWVDGPFEVGVVSIDLDTLRFTAQTHYCPRSAAAHD